jgi:hypothetical protein
MSAEVGEKWDGWPPHFGRTSLFYLLKKSCSPGEAPEKAPPESGSLSACADTSASSDENPRGGLPCPGAIRVRAHQRPAAGRSKRRYHVCTGKAVLIGNRMKVRRYQAERPVSARVAL